MIDSLEQHGYRDFNQRYQGCFCFYKDMLVRIKRSTDNGVEFEDSKGNSYIASDHKQPFEFMAISKGWYNSSDGPLFVARRAQRQWVRGVSDATLFVRKVKNGADCWGLKTIDFASLAAILEKEKEIEFSGQFPFAVSRNFALTDNFVLLWDQVVGTVEKDQIKVSSLYLNEFNQSASKFNVRAISHDF